MNKVVNPVPVEWSSGRWSQVSESVLDKSTWPAGPWMSEPDFVGWVDDASGRRCMMVRGSVHGAWLGYVDAIDLLPMFERVEPSLGSWSSLEMMQKAGLPESVIRAPRYCLSYAGRAWQMPGLWLGYDNAHADDYAPGMAAKGYTRAHPSQYITEAVAREHTLKIAAALHAFAMERKGGDVKERDILFSAPMVRAILEGRKTVTRRLVKPSPGLQSTWLDHDKIQLVPHGEMIGGGWQMHHPLAGTKQPYGLVEHDSPFGWVKSPFGDPGDRLWVREPFIAFDEERVHYKADFDSDPKNDKKHEITWTQSSMMPRWASRLLLEVITLRVERLHEITEEDAKAEGLQMSDVCVGYLPRALEMGLLRYEFANRWSDSNKRYPWASNPWVWRVEFRKVAT